MKILSASTLAALALGLMLSGSAAYAADGPYGGAQGNQDTQQNRENAKHDKGDKTDKSDKSDKTDKGDRHQRKPAVVTPTNTDSTNRANRRGRDNMRPVNQNNRNRWDKPSNVTPVNQNNGNNWNNRNNNRRNADMSRWHRNFNAPHRFRAGVYHAPRGYSYRRYSYGQRLPRDYYERSFWLADFLMFGLETPPDGYTWVRYGDDALLIDEETGEIVQVQYDVFYS